MAVTFRAFCFIERENEVLLILRLIEKVEENVRIALILLRAIHHGEAFFTSLKETIIKFL